MTVALATQSGDLVKVSDRHDWIVCGWFTEDPVYRPLAEKLTRSLDEVGAPYDFVSVPKLSGGWEVNTMVKPQQVVAAMDRHPDKTIVFIDVDMTAHGDIAPLADIPSDISFMIQTRRRRNGSVKISVNSQAMIIRPTPAARRFMQAWVDRGKSDVYVGDVDQSTLALAFGSVYGCGITNLDPTALRAVLRHTSHKPGRHQMSGFLRETANLGLSAIRAINRRRHAGA